MPVSGVGDLIEYDEGDGVAVEVTASSAGNVALRGQGVALTGQNDALTEVSLVETAGNGIGFLARTPGKYTGNQGDYAAGDSAGRTEVLLYKPIVLVPVDSAYTPAVGDEVEWSANGEVQLYASADAPSPYGVVWRTFGDPAAPSKAQVALYR
jgi:hypothetical protein